MPDGGDPRPLTGRAVRSPVVQTFAIAVGDTGPDLVESLFEVLADGTTQAANLTGAANVTFHLYDDTGTEVVTGAAAVLTANPAKVSYTWQAGDTTTGGSFLRRWTATVGGEDLSWPNNEDGYPVIINDPAVTPATGRLTCNAWCSTADVVRCGPCSGTAFDTDVLEEAVQIASDLLFMLSGRQFSGVCPDVVRPVCGDGGWWFPGVGSYSLMDPLHRWNDYVSDRRFAASEIRLPAYPIHSVTQVRIDGVVLAPTAYQIADDRWLMRTDGFSWPCSQDMRLPATQVDTWEVQYTYGVPIPPAGVRAAAEYACQIARACGPADSGGECALPPRTQTIVRQGLTVRTLDPADLTDQGRTGLSMVDAWIKAVNPHGLQERAAVLSPDTDWPAIRLRSG